MTRAAWESPPDSAFSGPALARQSLGLREQVFVARASMNATGVRAPMRRLVRADRGLRGGRSLPHRHSQKMIRIRATTYSRSPPAQRRWQRVNLAARKAGIAEHAF